MARSEVRKSDTQGRIKELEEELSKTKYNKRTQHHIGLVKAKIRQLKEQHLKKSSGGGKTDGYQVRKTGDATVIMVGFPSVGKSTLLNNLTNAESTVAPYAFTTLTVIPGLLEHNEAQIQLLDVPGIVSGAASGRGRGKEVLACCYSADMVMYVIDIFHPEHLALINKEVYDFNLRVNQRRPDVKITRKPKGGISIGSTVKQPYLTPATAEAILNQYRIMNADVVFRDEVTPEQLCDAIEGNKKYLPALTIVTKTDLATPILRDAMSAHKPDLYVSAETGTNINQLKQLIYDKLSLMRVYCKETGKKADLQEPLILHQGDTLRRMCEKLHKDFVAKFKFARIWGKSVKFDGQKVLKLHHKLKDTDVVEIHLR